MKTICTCLMWFGKCEWIFWRHYGCKPFSGGHGTEKWLLLIPHMFLFSSCAEKKINKEKWMIHPGMLYCISYSFISQRVNKASAQVGGDGAQLGELGSLSGKGKGWDKARDGGREKGREEQDGRGGKWTGSHRSLEVATEATRTHMGL